MTADVPVASSSVNRSPRRRLWRTLLQLTVLAAVVCLAVWGREQWRQYRTAQYKEACSKARDKRAWGKLDQVSDLWLTWDPENDDARLFRAEALLQAGRLREAADVLALVHEDYRGALQAYAFQGEILFGDLDLPFEAEQAWLRMLRLDERADSARSQLIYLYSMTLQREKLKAILRQAIELGREPPESYTYLVLSKALNFTDGMTVLEKWRKNDPDNEILEVAEAYYIAKNRTDAADGLYQKSDIVPGDLKPMLRCLEKYPNNVEVLAFHLEKASFDGDARTVARLLKAAPPEAAQDSRLWKFRAWLLKTQGQHAAALESINKSIELDPYDWRARWEKASLLRLLGRAAEAETTVQLANAGKTLEKKLMEQPNAQLLTWGIVEEMHDYVQQLGDQLVVAGLERRMPEELLREDDQASSEPTSAEQPAISSPE